MAREMRGELQSEVARLQQALDLATSEAEMLRKIEREGPGPSGVAIFHGQVEQRSELAAALKATEAQVMFLWLMAFCDLTRTDKRKDSWNGRIRVSEKVG